MAPPTPSASVSVSEEYRILVDKSYSKFSRLREFPPFGRNKWDTYYHKAFQVYSKLWKFQQENRQKLVETGLKRWEIGEIASRIGQLYYNYYLRTSDSKFLSESYIFYEAIMSREYFKDTGKDTTLANKQLRFYARFIVICLLLNRREMVHHLVRQFRVLVDDYCHSFQGNDSKEWKLVVQEIMRFMKADAPCDTSRPLRYSVLLDPAILPEVSSAESGKSLRLQDAILASYYHNEVKFSELTLDTFRMLQSLEWEPSGTLYRTKTVDTGSASGNGPTSLNKGSLQLQIPDPSLPPNPHKYILYRPTVPQLLLALATACEELSSDSILLLYISASGKPPRSSHTGNAGASGSDSHLDSPTEAPKTSGSHDSCIEPAQEQNGVLPGSHISSPRSTGDVVPGINSGGLWLGGKRSAGINFLYPSDLLPFTRRPLVIVIDSDNSPAFEVISGQERGESAALLLSPTLQPVDDRGSTATSSSANGGNLFSFFLTAPLLAFCRVIGVNSSTLPPGVYEQLEKLVSQLSSQWGDHLASSSTIHFTWSRILNDSFLRQLIFRFAFCRSTFCLHTLFRNKQEYIPRCLPVLPEEASPTSKILETGIFKLATRLGVIDQFVFTGPNAHTNGAVKVKAQSPPLSARSQATSTGGDISDGSWSDSSEVVGGTKTGSVIEGR
ncbi:hypothetical protein MPTK1_3g03670 [Marchantia polymorpha subsp. ruderalis]|uniref:Protein SCAI n=2 Tax=Marchantia polymorpha TaxID=3197 RepID=A0A176WGX8_MARPO|nr:hypothetical protein AXG93_3242s1120 [Marchantia polymorpha subsp. ruderalis]PTQ44079.1 hypothetical protein MARPO_0022s0165 [Marchantia polymorpha]BBN04326.1 hypothetical protein Mp_3g03670 [Marchantia polymorpha subsp. ruderalis]|eukprot:PTQ44079.1 hypothetical protein MARPO_0022s0165 [Marchantia polymorpha]